MATEDKIAYLWRQYLEDKASEQELAQLEQWLKQQSDNQEAESLLVSLAEPGDLQASPSQERLNAILSRIAAIDKNAAAPRITYLRKWWWVAASILVLISAGTYFWIHSEKKDPQTEIVQATKSNISPGKAGAILTLADGRQVILDSMGNGTITTENGSQVILKNGHLTYDPTGQSSGTVGFNTTSTPRGRQFQVTLPDGTQAWLNAASSITYPTTFTGKERLVKITGEVYLEVAKNKQQPFIIDADGRSRVEVLGTSININAYHDEESTRTTLLEGSIKVSNAAQSAVLKPGQQADIRTAGQQLTVISNADIDKTLAWKNGLFNFNGADLYEVMRQLERWYNIEVRYEGSKSAVVFKGEMYRDVNLSDVLEVLQRMGVKFKMEGETLIVY